jgi:hypothetical protein
VIATGIMMAMIDIGPSPGSMPMKVPIRQPATTIRRFWSEKAAVEADHDAFEHGSDPHEERKRAQEDAEDFLHKIPDAARGERRDGASSCHLRSPRMALPPIRNTVVATGSPRAQHQRVGHHQPSSISAWPSL